MFAYYFSLATCYLYFYEQINNDDDNDDSRIDRDSGDREK